MRAVGVEAFLDIQHVQMGYVIVPQVLVFQAQQPDLAQPQAQQQALKTVEVQPVLISIANEESLDVEVLLIDSLIGA